MALAIGLNESNARMQTQYRELVASRDMLIDAVRRVAPRADLTGAGHGEHGQENRDAVAREELRVDRRERLVDAEHDHRQEGAAEDEARDGAARANRARGRRADAVGQEAAERLQHADGNRAGNQEGQAAHDAAQRRTDHRLDLRRVARDARDQRARAKRVNLLQSRASRMRRKQSLRMSLPKF